jgi:hypothetical protein
MLARIALLALALTLAAATATAAGPAPPTIPENYQSIVAWQASGGAALRADSR